MKTLRECVKEADEKGVAIGHFNISNLEALHAIYNAAKNVGVPIVIGLSEGEGDFVGAHEAVALIRALRERDNYPIFLNADHHFSFERVKKENRDILVEAELGFIGTSSVVLDKIPDGVSEETMTKPEDAKKFVEATGIDMLAPSVGNVHGMVKTGNPRLHPERVKAIREACGIPLVLHGGSGSMNEDFIACIKSGISTVHINTEIRIAFTNALRKSLADQPDEITPYKYMPPTVEAVQAVVEARLKLFNDIQ